MIRGELYAKEFKKKRRIDNYINRIMMAVSILTMLNTIITPAYAEENGVMPLGIIDDRGTGGSGTYADPYTESPWNGSIKSYDFLESVPAGGVYVELLVDPRDNISNDDVVINFKVTQKYIITQSHTPEFVQAYATFKKDGNTLKENLPAFSGGKSNGTLTIKSGIDKVDEVHVHVVVKLINYGYHNFYFIFTGN